MSEVLEPSELDREAHRTVLLALAGFSFSALLAVVAVSEEVVERNTEAVLCLLASFLAHLFALNLQGYKAKRWHDQAGDALMEIASLGLVLSIPAFVLKSKAAPGLKWLTLLASIGVWGVDFGIRTRIAGRTFYKLERLRDVEQGSQGRR